MKLKKDIEKKSYAVKFTAEENGAVIGWAYLYFIYNSQHQEPYGLVEDVYVEEKYRKQGIGTMLIHAVIEEAKTRGCYKLLGTSRHERPDVHTWYKKIGFEDYGVEFRMDFNSSEPIVQSQ